MGRRMNNVRYIILVCWWGWWWRTHIRGGVSILY